MAHDEHSGDGKAAAQSIIELRSVTKAFDRGRVIGLHEVDLTVGTGEFLVLIGLSGSGKSTLLRHLNGLHTPTSGTVQVLGQNVTALRGGELRRLRTRIGFVFQQFNLVGRATALENVCTGALGRLRGPRLGLSSYPRQLRRDALVQLERVGLGGRAFHRADKLSGGQQQRVAIARMLLQKPELVLADEPVASLDPESSGQVMELLFRVCREEGFTVVCSLHQVDLALGWASRIVGLRDGRVVLDEPATALSHEDVMSVYKRMGASDTEAARLLIEEAERAAAAAAASEPVA